jgi:DDE superfamily endonuclease
LGFEDETWWSRLAQPNLKVWAEAEHPVRLMEKTLPPTDPGPKALACYGLLARWQDTADSKEKVWLRFAEGHPVSGLTISFLTWCCEQTHALGKRVLALIWDNASWHLSAAVKKWLRAHNQQVKRQGHGVRVIVCPLPIKSPWLNSIEPLWMHGKQRVVEPGRVLPAQELVERVCQTFECVHEEPLTIPEDVP